MSARWNSLKRALSRQGGVTADDWTFDESFWKSLQGSRILVIGAGGLGCELLKSLALTGFQCIDVIDMDTIDLSNLNRQFLFREHDIGQPKAVVAANFINKRMVDVKVNAHFGRIEDFDDDFYRQFSLIILGLDSVAARRWINAKVCGLLQYSGAGDNRELDHNSVIPLIDGGTEGFKGMVRIIMPGVTACIECMMDLFPPETNYPLCTIASTPRLPEHCVEFVKVVEWPREEPFGKDVAPDGDDPKHLSWIFEKSQIRAEKFNILGVTMRLTQGVVKRIVPAVASTNAMIASACVTEGVKLLTGMYNSNPFNCENNFIQFNDIEGVSLFALPIEKKDDCFVCSSSHLPVSLPAIATMSDLVEELKSRLGLRDPAITMSMATGVTLTVYMSMLAEADEDLKARLVMLGIATGTVLYVADTTLPKTLSVLIELVTDEV